jgi:hypothetical protein
MTWLARPAGQTCHGRRRPLTGMSVFRSRQGAHAGGSPAEFHDLASMARGLHFWQSVVVAATLAAGGCVIPPDLQQETSDLTANAPPIVVSVKDEASQEYPSPGPRPFVRGQGEATVTVLDIDTADTLFVQFFVDYDADDPTPARSPLCRIAPPEGGEVERTLRCDLRGLCTSADVGPVHFLEVEVYDREPRPDPTVTNGPLFREVPEPGRRSARAYLMTCEEPSPS